MPPLPPAVGLPPGRHQGVPVHIHRGRNLRVPHQLLSHPDGAHVSSSQERQVWRKVRHPSPSNLRAASRRSSWIGRGMPFGIGLASCVPGVRNGALVSWPGLRAKTDEGQAVHPISKEFGWGRARDGINQAASEQWDRRSSCFRRSAIVTTRQRRNSTA